MPEPIYEGTSTWWRFSAYEVADTRSGPMIVPAATATLARYRPWQEYLRCTAANESPPHVELVELFRAVEAVPGNVEMSGETRFRKFQLTPELRKWLLDWCRRFGLLGLLQHQTISAALWPRYMKTGTAKQVEYHRSIGAWAIDEHAINTYDGNPKLSTARHDAPEREGEKLRREDFTKSMIEPGVIAKIKLDSPAIKRRGLGEIWGPYFRNVNYLERDSHFYPEPSSEDFWRAYGEPVTEFFSAALILERTIRNLEHRRPAKELERAPQAERRALFYAMSIVEELAAAAPIGLQLNQDGAFGMEFACNSLLGALATMTIWDAVEGRVALRCVACGSPVRARKGARYCSERCRKRLQIRAYRARKKDEQAKAARAATKNKKQAKKRPAKKGRR